MCGSRVCLFGGVCAWALTARHNNTNTTQRSTINTNEKNKNTHKNKNKNKKGDYAALVKEPKAAAWMLAELTAAGKADKLKGFEMVKAVHLESEAFSVDNDTLTPSFKLKRPQLQKKYQKEVDAMYVAQGL